MAGKYGNVVIISGEFKGVKALYFTDIQNKALLNPLTNLDFEIFIPYSYFDYIEEISYETS
jgi:hypothetical protein